MLIPDEECGAFLFLTKKGYLVVNQIFRLFLLQMVFKVNFAKNTIVSCTLVVRPTKLADKYVCEKVNGKPIYALIEAANEEEARAIADQILINLAIKS